MTNLENGFQFNERRVSDKRLVNIETIVHEIHQRQIEYTLPAIQKIQHTLDGNGKKGLLREHETCQQRVEQLEKSKSKIEDLAYKNLVVLIIFVMSTVFSAGMLYWQVQNLHAIVNDSNKIIRQELK